MSPSVVNRIALIDARLRSADWRLFVYSPADLRADRAAVAGYVYEDGDLVPTEANVPQVNGNWTSRTRQLLARGMGYHEFQRWAAERRVASFVPHAFSELLANKLETYKLVRGFHETLHPHCEDWTRSRSQLEHFVETGSLCFVKPRSGSKGNRIVTIRREPDGLSVTLYHKGRRRRVAAKTIAEAQQAIEDGTLRELKYIIQHGVETMRHEGCTFDIRVTMLHDGKSWRWLHEARMSPAGSDVSNISQGGEITVTEDLLFDVLGEEGAQHFLYELRSESFGLAAYLERLHPGEIPEVAFDFAVDRDGRLKLLEVNTKPGLAGIGSDVSIHDKRPEHEAAFERWVYPHTRYLAQFLLAKVAGQG
jgi:hypothetical protein